MSHEDSANGAGLRTVDLSRAPLGELTAAALVAAARASDDRIERHYLEIKGPIDLRSKRDGAKVAKFILGAANRTTELASNAFEGYAVMVIGIDRNAPGGVDYVEAMDIARSVEPFIGVTGVAPTWDLVRVPAGVEGRDILLVVVDPPQRQKRAPYVCRANGEGLTDGAVYVRADGETRLARSGELELLFARARSESPPDPDFAVAIKPGPARIVIDVDAATAEYIAAVRESLSRAALIEPHAGFATASSVERIIDSLRRPETRTPAEYAEEIDAWEDALRSAASELPKRLAGSVLPPTVVHLTNASDTFLHDVQLVVHLEGSISGYRFRRRTRVDDLDWDLPDPPRKWGPHHDSALLGNLRVPMYSTNLLNDAIGDLTGRTSWQNSGSVTITIDVGDVRPRAQLPLDDEELVLALPGDYPSESVSGTWQITARDHHKVYSGSLRVSTERTLDLTRGAAGYLRELAAKLKDTGQN